MCKKMFGLLPFRCVACVSARIQTQNDLCAWPQRRPGAQRIDRPTDPPTSRCGLLFVCVSKFKDVSAPTVTVTGTLLSNCVRPAVRGRTRGRQCGQNFTRRAAGAGRCAALHCTHAHTHTQMHAHATRKVWRVAPAPPFFGRTVHRTALRWVRVCACL